MFPFTQSIENSFCSLPHSLWAIAKLIYDFDECDNWFELPLSLRPFGKPIFGSKLGSTSGRGVISARKWIFFLLVKMLWRICSCNVFRTWSSVQSVSIAHFWLKYENWIESKILSLFTFIVVKWNERQLQYHRQRRHIGIFFFCRNICENCTLR